MNSLMIDLPLHKAIEAHRMSMAESQLDIVKRVFSVKGEEKSAALADLDIESLRVRHPRRGGDYEFSIKGETRVCHSLKEVLRTVILEMEKAKNGTIERIATYRTPRGRRVVARRDVEIYPGNMELVKNSAEKLNTEWWYDTNLSKNQLKRYIQKILDWSGFEMSFVHLKF